MFLKTTRSFIAAFFSCLALLGCVTLSDIGLGKPPSKTTDPKDGSLLNGTKKISLSIKSQDSLNLSKAGTPLSLVVKIYLLRSTEKFLLTTPQQLFSEEMEKTALGDDLISTREIILLPNKNYDIPLVVPSDAVAIGVAGLFRTPYTDRWRVAFELAKTNKDNPINIGTHACALTADKGPVVTTINTKSSRTLAGVKCSS